MKRKTIVAAALCLMLSPLLHLHALSGTQDLRSASAPQQITLHLAKAYPEDPFLITGVFYEGHKIAADTILQLPADWYVRTTFRVENRSSQPITQLHFLISFPETATSERPQSAAPITLGNWPAHALFTGTGEQIPPPAPKAALLLAPGQTVDVSLSEDGTFAAVLLRAEEAHVNISRVIIQCTRIYFGDGRLAWGAGGYSKPANAAGKWTRISLEEFNSYPEQRAGDSFATRPAHD